MVGINIPHKNLRVLVDTDHGFIVDSWDFESGELRGGHFGGGQERNQFRSWLFKRNGVEGKVRMTLDR